MATNLPSCFSIQFVEQLLKFLVNFTLLKYVKSQRSYGFLITKRLIFGFQILDLKDHFSASLNFTLQTLTIEIKLWRMLDILLKNLFFEKKPSIFVDISIYMRMRALIEKFVKVAKKNQS